MIDFLVFLILLMIFKKPITYKDEVSIYFMHIIPMLIYCKIPQILELIDLNTILRSLSDIV